MSLWGFVLFWVFLALFAQITGWSLLALCVQIVVVEPYCFWLW